MGKHQKKKKKPKRVAGEGEGKGTDSKDDWMEAFMRKQRCLEERGERT